MNLPSSFISNRSPEKQKTEQQSDPSKNPITDLRSSSDPCLSSSGSHDISENFPYLNKNDLNPLTSFSYPLSTTQRTKYSQHTSITHWDPLSPQISQQPQNYQLSSVQTPSPFPPFASFHSTSASNLSISPSGPLPPTSSSINIAERVNTSIASIMPNPANPMNAGTLRMSSSASGNKQVLSQFVEVCENLLQLVHNCKDGVVMETHFFKMYESVKSLNLLMSFIAPSLSTSSPSPSRTRSSSPSTVSNLQALASASVPDLSSNSPIQLPPVSQIANFQSIWPSSKQKGSHPTSQYTRIDSHNNNNSSPPGQGTGSTSPDTPSSRSASPTDQIRYNPYKKIINRNRRNRKGKSVQIKDEERMCAWCSCTQTPEWRNGPSNSMLCNACGLQYRNLMKQEREEKEKNAIGKILNPSQSPP